MHDMPMTNTEDKPVTRGCNIQLKEPSKYRLKEGVVLAKCDDVFYITDDNERPRIAIDFRGRGDQFLEPIPDTPKPLWELMPEIVKGRRFRHVDWHITSWGKIVPTLDGYEFNESGFRPMPEQWYKPNYILEPIE